MDGRSDSSGGEHSRWVRVRARELGDRVRARRMDKGLSQEELGERSGLHRTYIGQVERGEKNVSVRNLIAIADGLGVDVAELVQGLRRGD